MFDEKVMSKIVLANLIMSIAVFFMAIVMVAKVAFPTDGIPVAEAQKAPQPAAKPAAVDKISEQYGKKTIDLQKAIAKGKPVAVLFYADWCGFCKRFAPTFAELAKDKDLKKKYTFVYVNSDEPENRIYMQQYAIKGFPTLYLINPKTVDKAHVSNGLMFQADAFNIMKDQFEKFLTEGSSAVTQPQPAPAEEEEAK